MIVAMRKIFVVSQAADADRLLEALRSLSVVHLVAVEPARAVADPETVTALDSMRRALQIMDAIRPAGQPPELGGAAAAAEVLRIHRESAEWRARLANLHRQVEQQTLWGDVRLEQLAALRAAGVEPRFMVIPAALLGEVEGECVEVLAKLPAGKLLVGMIDRRGVDDRNGESELPAGAELLAPLTKDNLTLRAEAARLDGALVAESEKLGRLAGLGPQVRQELARLEEQAAYAVAARGGLAGARLYALQGWVPVTKADAVAEGLSAAGLTVAVEMQEPLEDEQPPTMIQAPRWARPIEGLLKVLNTVPGYRERDVTAAFMIALPIFAAMLIGDGGYGLLFLLVPAIFYRKAVKAMGADLTHLIMVLGAMALVWGVITASYFGYGPDDMAAAGGLWASVAELVRMPKLLSVDVNTESQDLLKRISFLLGVIHLSAAHLWRAKVRFPDIRFLSNVGWALALWGVYGLVKNLVLSDAFSWQTPWPYLLCVGFLLAVGFASPSKYVIGGLVAGLLNSIFPAIATMSDLISYVRLMAIALAGSVLAVSFNRLAWETGTIWAAVPILLVGHSLNIALAMIALLAHGVRLNILEFSSNLGMEWSGYPYEPFAKRKQENQT